MLLMNQKQLISFVCFWIANSAVFFIASQIFKGNVVLGNDRLAAYAAAILSGLILTVGNSFVSPLVAKSGLKIKNDYTWPAIFLAANIVLVWIIKRLAIVTGLGISSVLWVVIVAILVNLAQFAVAKATGAMDTNKK